MNVTKNFILASLITLSFLNYSCSCVDNYEQMRNEKICQKMKLIMENDQKFRNTDNEYKLNLDSQRDLDKQNTAELIKITKAKGWPTKNLLGCENSMPVAIFRHSPEEYWDQIKPLIELEFKEKRMTEGDYKFILNHLENRPLNLNIEGVDIIIK